MKRKNGGFYFNLDESIEESFYIPNKKILDRKNMVF